MERDGLLNYGFTDPVEQAIERAIERLLKRDRDITWRAICKEGAKEIHKMERRNLREDEAVRRGFERTAF